MLSDILTCQISDLEKVQYHGIQLSQCCHLLTNIKIYKSHPVQFCTSSRFWDNNATYFYLKRSRARSWSTIFAMTPFEGNNQNLQKSSDALFLTISEILTFHVFDLQKGDQDDGVQFSQLGHSMAIVKIYKRNFLHFFITAKVWPILTIVTHAHTHRYTYTQKRKVHCYRRNHADFLKNEPSHFQDQTIQSGLYVHW